MKKLINNFIFFIIIFFFCFNHVQALTLNSPNVILLNNNTNQIIYSQNADEKIYPASLTKIMTVTVALEKIKNIKKEITLTDAMFKNVYESGASVAGFQPYETVTYEDLLYGAMLPSGADATNALAISLFGSMDKFITAMNNKAKELKLKNTHFVNCTGLHNNNHYSTVADIAKLLQYALKDKEFRTIFTTKTYTSGTHIFYSTFSKYSALDNLVIGGKTGFTDEAGLCLASIADDEGKEWILVTAHAPSGSGKPLHAMDQAKIYKKFFKLYNYQTIVKKGDNLGSIKIKNGNISELNLIASKNIKIYNKKINIKNLHYKFNHSYLLAPININDKIGTISIIYKGKVLSTMDVFANKEIKLDLKTMILLYIKHYWYLIPIIIFIILIIKFKHNIGIFYRNIKKIKAKKKRFK